MYVCIIYSAALGRAAASADRGQQLPTVTESARRSSLRTGQPDVHDNYCATMLYKL